ESVERRLRARWPMGDAGLRAFQRGLLPPESNWQRLCATLRHQYVRQGCQLGLPRNLGDQSGCPERTREVRVHRRESIQTIVPGVAKLVGNLLNFLARPG